VIARNGQPHTSGKDLILPATRTITTNLFSEQHVNEVSENIVKRRIYAMPQNVKDILLKLLHHSEYIALQLDESHATIFQIVLVW
jgi:hypothetical protein